MKKIIMALGVAAMGLGFVACNNSESASKIEGPDAGLFDSLSTLSGELNGAMFAKNYEALDSVTKSKFQKEQFLKGLREVYLGDTANLGYILGLQVGMNILQQQKMMNDNGAPTNRQKYYDEFAKAFKLDSVPEARLQELQAQLQPMQMRVESIVADMQQKRTAAMMEAQEKAAKEAEAKGKAYVDKQKAADKDIQTTADGLSYKVVAKGEGPVVTDNDRVKVNYVGKLIDGTVFDKGDSVAFSPRGVVPGFAEGLKMMQKGTKMVLYIPSDLGYGPRGAGEKIGPGETLVFEVEALEILPGNTPKK